MRFEALIMLVLVCVPSSPPAGRGDGFPLSIRHINVRCMEVLKKNTGHTETMPPHEFYAITGYRFRATFEIRMPNDTSSSDTLFSVVGSLPGNDWYSSLILRQNLTRSGTDICVFSVDLKATRNGWAEFILTPPGAGRKATLDDYDVRSNRRGVFLECYERSDVEK